ncbi:MAG TPA: c-type cytochrome [Burkholderiaceae bacterium]|nr:c-type cytochrome [Burkholderiaceae bacterium]
MQNKVEPVEDTSTAPQGLIKTPKQLMITVVLAFVIPISIIILLVNLASFSSSMGAGSSAQTSEAIAERIQPVASFKLVDADTPEESLTGEEVYKATCASCHGAGVAGAPTFGDADDWAPLIDDGLDAMVKIAIEGKGAMPPRGGNSNLSDHEVTLAVVYMANEAGGSFDEPTDDGNGAAASDDTDDTAAAEADDADEADEADEADTQAADTEDKATDSADDSADQAASDNGEEDTDEAASDEDDSAADNGEEDSAEAASEETAELDPAGQKLYDSVCFTCHTAGVAGAPKIGDQSDWDPYIETGMEAMVENAIKGVGAMPPRGGSSASDEEIEAAIEYILSTLD